MTHKFNPGDELDFEDHRNRFSRPQPVVVCSTIAQNGAYMVSGPHGGRQWVACEDELSRRREEWPANYDAPARVEKMR